jgi:putative inorganic carbon (hco3(-)) transporter
VIALLETVGPKSLVFPRYIENPGIGIHFGRARGPFVEAAANGLALIICGVAATIALVRWRNKLLPLAVLLLCAAGAVFTLTRQIWLAAVVATVVAMLSRRELRILLVPAAALAAMSVFALFAFVPGFSGKAHSRADDERPVWDRLNSNDAAERMILARPITGFGWATFGVKGLQFYRQAADRPLTVVARPHNVLLANGAELGVPMTLVWLASLGVAVLGGLRRRGPPDLDDWRTGLVAVAVAWFVVANFTPMNYAFCHAALWLWAGLTWSRT